MAMPDARTRAGHATSTGGNTHGVRVPSNRPPATVLMEIEWSTGKPATDLREIEYPRVGDEIAGAERLIKSGAIVGATFTVRLGSHATP